MLNEDILKKNIKTAEVNSILYKLRNLKNTVQKYGITLNFDYHKTSETSSEVTVDIDIPSIKVSGNTFNYMGSVEKTSEGNILLPASGYDGKKFIEKYGKQQDFVCDKCQSKRDRLYMHIFSVNNGEDEKTYGTKCAQDFFGIDFFKQIEWIFQTFGGNGEDNRELPDDEEEGRGRRSRFAGINMSSVSLLFVLVEAMGNRKPSEYYEAADKIMESNGSSRTSDFYGTYKQGVKVFLPEAEYEPHEEMVEVTDRYGKKSRELKKWNILTEDSFNKLNTILLQKQEQMFEYWKNIPDSELRNSFMSNAKLITLSALKGNVFRNKNRKLFVWGIYLFLNKSKEAKSDEVGGGSQETYKGDLKNKVLDVVNIAEKESKDGRKYLTIVAKTETNNFIVMFANTSFIGVKKVLVLDYTEATPGKYGDNNVLFLKGAKIDKVGEEKAATVSGGFFGEIGKRYKNMSVTVVEMKNIGSFGGGGDDSRIVKMKLDTGEIVYTYNSNAKLEIGQKVKIDFTVKQHKEYKGDKSTYVNRTTFYDSQVSEFMNYLNEVVFDEIKVLIYS